MHYHNKRNIRKKRVNRKQPLAWSTLLLEGIFQGSKKFMQLSLKPKNPSLRKNIKKGDQKYEKFESVRSVSPRAKKSVLNFEIQFLFIEARMLKN